MNKKEQNEKGQEFPVWLKVMLITALILIVLLGCWFAAFFACYASAYACVDPSEVPGWFLHLLGL